MNPRISDLVPDPLAGHGGSYVLDPVSNIRYTLEEWRARRRALARGEVPPERSLDDTVQPTPESGEPADQPQE